MKNGFTLMELLVVIVIVSVISVSSVLAFGNIDDSTAIKDRINLYKDIQRKAILYADLDNGRLNDFRTDGVMNVTINTLIDDEYINADLEDPVTGDVIPGNYFVKVYIANDGTSEYVDTCILDTTEINSVYCNTDVRKCCNQEDMKDNESRQNSPHCGKYVNGDEWIPLEKIKYENGTAIKVNVDENEEDECLRNPQNCSCYSPKLCKKKTCVANSQGEPFDCCAKATD